MIELDGHRVVATHHAAEQALRRIETLRGADRIAARRWVELSVARAIRDGRRARTAPRFAIREWSNGYKSRGKTTQNGMVRFFWNENETAAFVACLVKDELRGARSWIVKTVITAE